VKRLRERWIEDAENSGWRWLSKDSRLQGAKMKNDALKQNRSGGVEGDPLAIEYRQSIARIYTASLVTHRWIWIRIRVGLITPA
jgi:hypothetical protein